MVADAKSPVWLADGALGRLMALAAKGVPPPRMAPEVGTVTNELSVLLRASSRPDHPLQRCHEQIQQPGAECP